MASSVDTSLNPHSVTVPVTELYTAVQEEQLEELKVILDGIDLSRVLQCHLLHNAASHGQVKTVRLLITRYKWPVNCRNENKQTPLHVACGSGYLEVVRMLVTEYKADLKAHDKDGDTPLHVAARHGCINVIECLVDVFKCDPSTTGCEGRTILHYACYQGHTELVKMLLRKHQMNPLFNDNNGNNSLHYAVRGDWEKIAKTLTNNYHDLYMAMDCRNKYNQSPLDVACSNGHLKIAKIFVVNHGLKRSHDENLLCITARYGQTNTINFLIDEFRYTIKERDGMTIVQLACCNKRLEVVEVLLARCKSSLMGNNSIADIKGTDGCTLLHLACQQGHLGLVERLVIDYKLDPLIGDHNGNTPLHYAALAGRTEVATLLMTKYGTPVNHQNNNNETPLHLACTKGYIAFVQTLVTEHKADVNICDINNSTPLQRAALSGQAEVVACFIKIFNFSADVKLGTNDCSLLHLACQGGHLELAEQLMMDYKLNPLIDDDNGNTPLHYAALAGRTEVATLLITKYGTPVNCLNSKNETPLYFACAGGNLEVVRMLANNHGGFLHSCGNNSDTPLHKAAICGQAAVVNCLINEFRCNPKSKGYEGRTILHHACYQGHIELAEALLTHHKLDPLSADVNGYTPLHLAGIGRRRSIANVLITKYGHSVKGTYSCSLVHLVCKQGDFEMVEQLLSTDYKFDPMTIDDNGNTPLHYAAISGNIEVATLLITKHGVAVDYLNNNNETPLHLACNKGHSTFIQTLVIEHKADINTCDMNNHTPLQRAVLSGQAKVVDFFIKKINYSADVKGTNGCSLLHLACQQGHLELVEQLVTDYKFDPLIGDDDGNTPLHYAALAGRTEVATLLITKYGTPVNHLNNNDETLLHLACTQGHRAFIQTLVIEHKADINTCDMKNHTPLQRAILSGQAEVVECFIKEYNCSADVKGIDGCSLLHLACQQGYLELVEQLVTDYKLDPLIGDDNGNTPLHYAALAGRTEVVTLLIIKYGSPANLLNKKGETPLHLACTKGHLAFIRTFVTEHKADINISDINSHTPLQRAALCGHTKVVCSLVLQFGCDCSIIGAQGRNLLHYACLDDHDILARQLIDSFHFSLISVDTDGNSPLHISAMFGQKKCVHLLLHTYHAPVYLRNNSGKSALEVVRDVDTKRIMNAYLKEEHNRIQYGYKKLQSLSKKKYSGAQRLTRVFVLGNVQSGKSTLIESLKRQGFFSSFSQVSEATVPPHTSGIIPSEYCNKTIGRVVYYDFAGESEYYSSHSAIMSSIMQSEEGTNICLILVDLQNDNKYILEELGYWFSFISYHCVNLKEKCKVLTIGSHVDLVKTNETKRRKVALVSEFTDKYLSLSSKVSIDVVKSESDLIINCCNPRSSTCVYSMLNQIVEKAPTFRLSREAAILLGLLEKDFKNVVTCKVQTLVTHIIETEICLPNTADSIYPKVMELHTVGLLMVIESTSSELEDYLLLLNVPKLTNEVHKLLFSKDSAKKFLSSIDPCSASMGILPQTYLNSILPEYITTECLVQLQYCQEFSHAEVKLDYSVITTGDFCAPRLLYFPALCETERKNSIKTPETYDYSISWYVKCCGEFDYLPPRFLHVLLLRLAHTFALPAAHKQPSNPTVEEEMLTTIRLYNHRCTMWKNGIHWLMTKGVECYVEMVNSNKGMVIITKSKEARKFICTEILFKIIQEIHQAKEKFCETVTLQEYLMDSNDPGSYNDEDKLFLISDPHFTQVLSEGNPLNAIVSINGKKSLDVDKILHLAHYIHWDAGKKDVFITYTLPVALNIKLSERHQSFLSLELKTQSTEWKSIAIYLGFTGSELRIIEAKPLLLSGAPTSWLNEMLSEWLQWAPGDGRGSTKIATLEGLRDALDKAGLGGDIIAYKLCHRILLDYLTKESHEWRKIGEFLGFHPSELDTIQERSQESCLSTMLTEWFRWAPGDKRGSAKSASLEGLRDALNEAGLVETAQSIVPLEPAT